MIMQSTTPSWLADAVIYQIYPQSFYDSNGDGIGDIPGILSKLDYLQDLGVNVLWLTPCFESPFQDAGYDVSDFRKVAPRYGTNDDLEALFADAHRRNMKVCLDLVAGHTSIEHPWFKASCQPEKNAYSDYYIWTNNGMNAAPDSGLKFINGYSDRNGCYASNFFYSQPALNYGFANPDPRFPWQQPIDAPGPQRVREELRQTMRFWLDCGADGFRVDMAPSLIKNDPDRAATTALWQDIRQWLDHAYPEAVLIAEWGNPSQSIAAGYHIDFMLHCGVPGYPSLFFRENIFNQDRPPPPPFFTRDGNGDVTEFAGEYLKQYTRTQGRGYISIPSANHDFQRPNWDRKTDELKTIMLFLLTWAGVPTLYYGDEIGMRYQPNLTSKEGGFGRTGTRTPMQWDHRLNAGFSSAEPEALYLPIDPEPDRPHVADQAADPNSLLSLTRELLALRHKHPALQADGGLRILYAHRNQYPFVFERFHENERFIIVINPADRKEVTTIPRCATAAYSLTEVVRCGEVTATPNGTALDVASGPCSAAIFQAESSGKEAVVAQQNIRHEA